MFTKIEKWLRRIVTEEVEKIELSTAAHVHLVNALLEDEKNKLVSAISIHAKSTLNNVEAESIKLFNDFEQKLVAEAALVVAEKNKLIQELHEKVADLEATARKITHWKADTDTVATDHSLKVVK